MWKKNSPTTETEIVYRSPWQLAWRELRRNRLAVVGLCIVLSVTVVAALAPWISPADPLKQNMKMRLQPPSQAYLLGSDAFGRDVLSRVIYGSRNSLLIGLTTIVFAVITGVPIGLIAGYMGGTVDHFLMRITDTVLTFPPILLALALMATLGPEVRNVVIALGIVYMPQFARLVRGSTLSAREEEYVIAARSIGVRSAGIMSRHILPNILAPIVVQVTATFSVAIVAASTLSFLGVGIQPPTPDWGRDLSEGRRWIRDAYWLTLAPAVAISLTVMSINFMGDGLRDALDPRFRSR